MDNENSSPKVTNCIFSGNTASIRGGVVNFKDLAVLAAGWLAGIGP